MSETIGSWAAEKWVLINTPVFTESPLLNYRSLADFTGVINLGE
jgi:hypothetical protein